MKRLIALGTMALFALALTAGCGKKESKESDKVPEEVKKAEQMDSTRMDSAADTMMMHQDDTTSEMGGE
ncbi:MAG TPA: hypothetical protein VJ983_04670 [candidate division Zixibacteria bacterium]|jgi:type IV pilus biogenesis protein CpaD/CtpE|nr:hypothetical protein [candidate division Zixibacteria bacterium]